MTLIHESASKYYAPPKKKWTPDPTTFQNPLPPPGAYFEWKNPRVEPKTAPPPPAPSAFRDLEGGASLGPRRHLKPE